MKRVFAVFAALAIGAAISSAQSDAVYHRQWTIAQTDKNFACNARLTGPDAGKCLDQTGAVLTQTQITAPPVCPVFMSARQRGAGGLVAVDHIQSAGPGPYQTIDLTLVPIQKSQPSEITEALVRVHGLTPRTRAIPADSVASGPAEITRTLHLTFDSQGPNARDAELALHGFTSVDFIELVSLTYADGSTWRHSEQACRVAPDTMMLIGAR